MVAKNNTLLSILKIQEEVVFKAGSQMYNRKNSRMANSSWPSETKLS